MAAGAALRMRAGRRALRPDWRRGDAAGPGGGGGGGGGAGRRARARDAALPQQPRAGAGDLPQLEPAPGAAGVAGLRGQAAELPRAAARHRSPHAQLRGWVPAPLWVCGVGHGRPSSPLRAGRAPLLFSFQATPVFFLKFGRAFFVCFLVTPFWVATRGLRGADLELRGPGHSLFNSRPSVPSLCELSGTPVS